MPERTQQDRSDGDMHTDTADVAIVDAALAAVGLRRHRRGCRQVGLADLGRDICRRCTWYLDYAQAVALIAPDNTANTTQHPVKLRIRLSPRRLQAAHALSTWYAPRFPLTAFARS